LAEVYNPKTAPKLGGQIFRQLLNQFVAVVGSDRARLFRLNDSSTDFPVHSGHDRIDIPSSSRARRLEQFDDSGSDAVVILNYSCHFRHRDFSV